MEDYTRKWLITLYHEILWKAYSDLIFKVDYKTEYYNLCKPQVVSLLSADVSLEMFVNEEGDIKKRISAYYEEYQLICYERFC